MNPIFFGNLHFDLATTDLVIMHSLSFAETRELEI